MIDMKSREEFRKIIFTFLVRALTVLHGRTLVVIKNFAQFSEYSCCQGLLFSCHRNVVSFADAHQLWLGQDRELLYVFQFDLDIK